MCEALQVKRGIAHVFQTTSLLFDVLDLVHSLYEEVFSVFPNCFLVELLLAQNFVPIQNAWSKHMKQPSMFT